MVKINLEKRLNEIEENIYFEQEVDRFSVCYNPELNPNTKRNLEKLWLKLEEFRRGLE